MSLAATTTTAIAWMVLATGTVIDGQRVQSAIAVQYPNIETCVTALRGLRYIEHNADGGRITIKPFCSMAMPNWWVPDGNPMMEIR